MNIDLVRRSAPLVLALGVACDDGAVADPGGQVQIAFTATSTEPDVVAVRSEEAQVSVERAWISLSALELVPCARDAAPVAMPGEYPLDLARERPSQAVIESAVSDYCELRIEMAPARSSAPDEISGLSAHFRGARSDGSAFAIQSTLVRTFDLAGLPEGTPFEARELVLGFDLARWFDGIDLDGAAQSDDGEVLIGAGSNEELLAEFEANAGASVALHVDADRDGVLDEDELTPIIAAP